MNDVRTIFVQCGCQLGARLIVEKVIESFQIRASLQEVLDVDCLWWIHDLTTVCLVLDLLTIVIVALPILIR